MQYFYLRKTAPGVRISFSADAPQDAGLGVNLFFATQPPAGSSTPRAEIALNCDSFPELGDATCRDYFERIPGWAPLLLSINQEGNREALGLRDRQSVVGALAPEYGYKRLYRFRSWVRRGFIEELWRSPRSSETML